MKINEVKKKNGSIVYRASVYLGVDAVTGKRVKTSITGRTKKEVKNKTQQAQSDFRSNGSTVFQSVNIKTYQELTDLWLESYKLTVKPQTYISTLSFLKTHILPTFGHMKLDKITPSLCQSFANQLSKKLVNFKVPHSINRRILQLGVTLQIIPYNPAREVIMPKQGKKGRQAVKFIDPSDLKTFLDYMEKQSNRKYLYYFEYVLYSLLLATGCRFGEVVALDWSDIDLDQATISITKTYSRQVNQITSPKSKAGIRTISIDKKTVNVLKLYRSRQAQLFREAGQELPNVALAVPNRIYQDMSIRQSALKQRCKDAGIPRFSFHAFRHTHASLLLNAGINYKDLQYRLGHANITMTLDIYGHLSKDKEKEAVSYYEKAINNL